MRLSRYLWALSVLGFCSFSSINAQVTIGNDEPAVHGAVLQLKNIKKIADGKANATKGLGLPRVALTDLDKLEPCVESTATNKKIHIGLIVYNTEATGSVPVGLNVWNGDYWKPLSGARGGGTSPWYKVGTTAPSSANTDDSYLQAKVVIGGTSPISGAQLSVTGATELAGTTKISGGALTYNNGTPAVDQVLTASDVAGTVIWKTLPADKDTKYTATNGMTLSGTQMKLGGALTGATNITGTAALGIATPTNLTGATSIQDLKYTKSVAVVDQVLTASDVAGTVIWKTLPADKDTKYTATNGMTLSGTQMKLGGALTGATNITGTAALGIATPTNLTGATSIQDLKYTKSAAVVDQVLTASDVAGTVIWKTLPADKDTKYTAVNGMTLSGTQMKLGGALTAATNITGTAALGIATPTNLTGATSIKDLKYTKTASVVGQVLTASDVAGTVIWKALPADADTKYTAVNGMTLSGTQMKLGGTLTAATSITGTAALTIAPPTTLSGITTIKTLKYTNTASVVGQVLMATDAAGTVAWKALPADVNTKYTAGNGLTLTDTQMKLGGTLAAATTITQNAFGLTITGTAPLAFTGTGALNVSKPTNITGATKITGTTHITGNTNVGGSLTVGMGGTAAAPLSGALVDIKQYNDATATGGGRTATKGIVLPRVTLTAYNSLAPLIAGGGTAAEKNSHKGAVVFHTGGANMPTGLKTWDGTQWMNMVTSLPPAIQSYAYDLKEQTRIGIKQGANYIGCQPDNTEAGVVLPFGDANNQIVMQEDGSYVFSLRLYGQAAVKNNGVGGNANLTRACYYLTLMVNGVKADVQEMNQIVASDMLGKIGTTAMLTGSNLKKGDKVQIRACYFANGDINNQFSNNINFQANPGLKANKTSMLFWKL